MDRESLIGETNAMLKQILELEAERKAAAERSRVELEEMRAKHFGERKTESPEEDLEQKRQKRFEDVQAKSKERIEELQAKDRQFKDELLAEMRLHSDLLRQIAEKLGV